MAQTTFCGKAEEVQQRDVQALFSYPATTFCEIIAYRTKNGTAGKVKVTRHKLITVGDPTTDHASAPNGSTADDYTNGDTYVKTGAPGSGIDGTWTQT